MARNGGCLIVVMLFLSSLVGACEVPMWERWLRLISGTSDATSVPIKMMGVHMQMSEKSAQQPGDAERAQALVDAAKQVLLRYSDAKKAEEAGYNPFHTTGLIDEEIHYTSVRWSYAEGEGLNADHPGSILYRRTASGLKGIGVMYGAPNTASAAELDRRAPLSIAVWHRHVDFCGAPKGAAHADIDGAQARFGFFGSIHTEVDCKAAEGYWIPVAFGWMTHIYPNETDPKKIWGGEEMNMSQVALPQSHAPSPSGE